MKNKETVSCLWLLTALGDNTSYDGALDTRLAQRGKQGWRRQFGAIAWSIS